MINPFLDQDKKRWKGEACIPFDYFPAKVDKFNFYAIHGTDDETGSRRYYKSFKAVPGEFPDFHRLQHFEDIADEDSGILSILKIRSNQSLIWRKALEDEK